MRARTNHVCARAVGACLLAACYGEASAQSLRMTQLYREGEAIYLPDQTFVGLARAFGGVAVNDAGVHLVEIDTDNPDGNADFVVMRSGVALIREGDPVPGLPGLSISSFDSLNLNSAGDVGWNLFLRGAPSNADSGLFFNSTLVLQESTISAATGFTPGTPYIGFFETIMNDQNRMLVMASVDDAAINTSVDRAVVIIAYDVDAGTYVETVLMKEGDTPPGMVAAIADFSTNPECMAFSTVTGGTGFIAEAVGGTTDTIFVNGAAVAREGQPSPIAGRNWRILNDVPLSVNNAFEFAFRATLDGDTGTDTVIVKNATTIIAQEGGEVPDGSGFLFTGFGTGPVFIDDGGSVTYFGIWNDPDTTRNRGLFRDDRLILQQGVSMVGSDLIVEILGVSEGYSQSADGSHLIVKVRYTGAIDAVLLLRFGCVADFDDGSGTGTPDGGVTIDDLLYYLNLFVEGDAAADIDDGSGNGTPDGGVTIDDLLFFLARFDAGC